MPGRALEQAIIGCTQCPANLVKYDWLPISYFGDFARASAWTISINPSSREFTDPKGMELTGRHQRFARITDFDDCASRADVASKRAAAVLTMQDTVLQRAPYRAYFNRLGRFISLALGSNSPDPLQPFLGGIRFKQANLLFCHLDIVKCATTSAWSRLRPDDQQMLVDNCTPYLQAQFAAAANVRYVLVNGKTASRELLPILRVIGWAEGQTKIRLGTTSTELRYGVLKAGAHPFVLAWTSNVVNQQLRAADCAALAAAVRQLLP